MDPQEALNQARALWRKCDAEADTLSIWRQQIEDALSQCPPGSDPQLRPILFDIRRNLILAHNYTTAARDCCQAAEQHLSKLTQKQHCADCPLISNPPCESSVPCCRCNEDCNSRQPCPKNPQKQ